MLYCRGRWWMIVVARGLPLSIGDFSCLGRSRLYSMSSPTCFEIACFIQDDWKMFKVRGLCGTALGACGTPLYLI